MSTQVPGDAGPAFDAKVRFAREVEACLRDPDLPPSPNLVLRVRERVLRERVRQQRRADMRRLVAAAAFTLAAGAVMLFGLLAPFADRLQHLADLPAVVALSRQLLAVLARPMQIILQLGAVGSITVLSLLAATVLYLLRDVFLDPLKGLASGRLGAH